MPSYGPEVLGPPERDPDQVHWDPAVQTMDPEQRRDLQLRRLHGMVGRVFNGNVGLFRRQLERAGVDGPEDFATLDDLASVPVIRKDDLRASEAEHPPLGDYRFVPRSSCLRIGQSSGTTGTPTLTLLTRRDLFIEYESAARNWWRNGWRPGQVVTHCHPGYLYGGGLMLSGTLEYFGFLNLWVPPPDNDELAVQALDVWRRIHPDVQMVALSQHRFQEVAARHGVDLEADCGFPTLQLGGFGRGLFPLMTAGFECYAYLGGPDSTCDGAHLHEDWAIVESVDPATGNPVPEGQWGSLVVTTLDRDNGLLRYDLEEAAMIESGPCPRGETSRRGFWGGRFSDLLSAQGRHFQVADLEAALGTVPQLREPTLEFVVERPDGSDQPLRVRVELGAAVPAEARADTEAVARSAIADRLGLVAVVDALDRNTLPRSGYKLKRVLDR